MPAREYQCKACGLYFEKLIFKGDPDESRCPKCGSRSVKPTPGSESFMSCSGIGTCAAAPPKGPS